MNFSDHLRRQHSFLMRSANSYDAGALDEAIRIATVIRVLIHDTKNSTSLLKHLGASSIPLLSTTRGARPESVMHFGLGSFTLGIGNDGPFARYAPNLDQSGHAGFLPVTEWWNQIVYVIGPGQRLSRRGIVLAATNQDGGAHVDSKLTPEYQALVDDGAVGYIALRQGDECNNEPIADAHFVAIRQMAYELLNSPALWALG